MATRQIFNFNKSTCSEFEQFLAKIEMLPPPARAWINAQRQKPETLGRDLTVEQIKAIQNAYLVRLQGRALQHLVGERGLDLPQGWKNDFAFNFDIVQRQVEDFCELGTWPAPGYIERIGVLLRRANRSELSERFERAWKQLTVNS